MNIILAQVLRSFPRFRSSSSLNISWSYPKKKFILTFPHCLHFPFSVRRWIQWWCVRVCSRYWRTPTSLNVGLHANWDRSISTAIQLACAMTLHAEHFIRGPCFCWLHEKKVKWKIRLPGKCKQRGISGDWLPWRCVVVALAMLFRQNSLKISIPSSSRGKRRRKSQHWLSNRPLMAKALPENHKSHPDS